MPKPQKTIRQKIFSWAMFGIIGFLIYMYYPENHFALQYQASIDCRRINDVHAIAALVERYHDQQGYYPLSRERGTEVPQVVSVIVSDKELPRSYSVRPPPEIRGMLIPPDVLDHELERILNEKVILPYDPQTSFAWEKRFYLYRTTADSHYSVTGTLFSANEHSVEQASHRHHYQVGSIASSAEKIQQYRSIKQKVLTCAAP
ncbi:MAG: hypothetical protein L3J28_08610 [Candidatus Polarisedimenticolaceae bacterium]|nr:hypothetical protein [Candidatus Polarisedimenticolaceae bacterium]